MANCCNLVCLIVSLSSTFVMRNLFFVLFNFTFARLFSIISVVVLTFINFADLIKNGLRFRNNRISFLFNIHCRCADTLTDVGTWAMCWTRQHIYFE